MHREPTSVTGDDPVAPDGPDYERLNQEHEELLQELRVLLPGIQVMFAFLLILPFTSDFEHASTFERATFFVAFVATSLGAVMFSTPSVQHRILFRHHDKESILRQATAATLVGTVCLAVAIVAVALLIGERLYGLTIGVVVGCVVAVPVMALWYVSPLVRRAHDRRR
jgi:uncharacterized membrane protein